MVMEQEAGEGYTISDGNKPPKPLERFIRLKARYSLFCSVLKRVIFNLKLLTNCVKPIREDTGESAT